MPIMIAPKQPRSSHRITLTELGPRPNSSPNSFLNGRSKESSTGSLRYGKVGVKHRGASARRRAGPLYGTDDTMKSGDPSPTKYAYLTRPCRVGTGADIHPVRNDRSCRRHSRTPSAPADHLWRGGR